MLIHALLEECSMSQNDEKNVNTVFICVYKSTFNDKNQPQKAPFHVNVKRKMIFNTTHTGTRKKVLEVNQNTN